MGAPLIYELKDDLYIEKSECITWKTKETAVKLSDEIVFDFPPARECTERRTVEVFSYTLADFFNWLLVFAIFTAPSYIIWTLHYLIFGRFRILPFR